MASSQPNNRRTVAAYEKCAHDYAASVSRQPSVAGAEALRRLADALPSGDGVLEIGSGPGWDADFLEGLAVPVHRTDVTRAFCEFQVQRGRRAEVFDLLTDAIEGRYAGVLMLCVLQHFERGDMDGVLRKLAQALVPEGALLLSYPLGEGEFWEHGDSGDYRVVLWSEAGLDERLRRAGFAIDWASRFDGRDGPWRTVLARRTR
ncbi:methyltransferase domain protein [Lysobacter antibioticus]|uniref:class I SAM-dependent methyltransferase n=1 Tax=Lysobacter antibioticus TaxID=84531 RepID=UPI0007172F8B|nr:methyltransferase domain-containing protein [Lysobacter antibioticus]ALN61368.1 methyltransferase domain protein [Lysobacter antibioticus]